MKELKYYIRYINWFFRELSYRFFYGKKRSSGPNMTEDEYNKWFGK
jgi:hypothetical protein